MLKNRVSQNIHCENCVVNHLCVARGLQPTEVEEVNAIIQKVKVVGKGEHIFHTEDPMECLYAVYTGSCKDYRLDENGTERIGNFYLPGDVIGLESMPQRKHLYSLVALEAVQLCVIPLEPLFELMKNNAHIMQRMLNITSFKMQNDQLIRMTTNANQRIADFILNILCRLQERQHYNEYISLPMSQLDISNCLGMAHETVNRILRKLHKDKIIKLDNKKIFIRDVLQLEQIATPLPRCGQVVEVGA